MPVDVLVVWGTPAAFAAKRATTTIPILIAGAGDVVNTGLVSNLARPDANLTGFIALNVDLESKRLELLKEAVPGLSRVVVLANPANPLNRVNLDIARRSVEKLGVKIEVVEAKSAVHIDGALAQIKKSRPVRCCSRPTLCCCPSERKSRTSWPSSASPRSIHSGNTPVLAGCSSMVRISRYCSNVPPSTWTGY